MSLIGIDVGSSSTKIAAYSLEGKLLTLIYKPHTLYHPFPGAWEVDPNEVWLNFIEGLQQITKTKTLKNNPPKVMGISASTREAFPVDKYGKPLGRCIMTADTRESGLEKKLMSQYDPEIWYGLCGHLPERMDPICRMLWWEKNHPSVMAKAKYFLGWGEFFALQLTGKAVTDMSHAARWLVYDFKSNNWSPERISQFNIRSELLPEVKPWGTIIGPVKDELVKILDLPKDIVLAVGANDAVCCTIGSGVFSVGMACLMSGSWENILIPTMEPPPASQLINLGVSIGPYPGKASWLIYALNPSGNSVINRVRNLLKVSIKKAENLLKSQPLGPSHIISIPHFSGATMIWKNGNKLRGSFLNLTLASNDIDIVKAVMEGIAIDLSLIVAAFRDMGVKVDKLRAVGGGSRSEWLTQLKADLTETTIEVINQKEAGTLGAALLAGFAAKTFNDIEKQANDFISIRKKFKPNLQRKLLYKDRIKEYKYLISLLLKNYYENWVQQANSIETT